MIVNIEYFLKNRNEFNHVSKDYDCEIPKGNCWRIVVKHNATGCLYEYWEEDCYHSLEDQLDDSIAGLEFTKILNE